MRMGIDIAAALVKLYPHKFEVEKAIFLIGNEETSKLLQAGRDPAAIAAGWNSGPGIVSQNALEIPLVSLKQIHLAENKEGKCP